MTIIHNAETSAACQLLYHCADRAASATDRAIIFRVIARLTGRTVTHVAAVWSGTR